MSRFRLFMAGALFGASCVSLAIVLVKWPRADIETVVESPQPSVPATAVPPSVAALHPIAAAPVSGLTISSAMVPDLALPLSTQPVSIASVPAAAPTTALPFQPSLPSLVIPVTGVKPGALSDTFSDARGEGRVHDAIDIMAARGTPVIAAGDGKVVKLFTSKQGGLTVYEFDPSSAYAYYYAHLDSYAPGVIEGKPLRRGELVGYVGSTGNASPDAPHLHFAIFILGPEKHWWQGTAINPYPILTGQQAQPLGVMP